MKEEIKTFEECVEFYKKQHEELLEKSKTEPISWVEVMKPIQTLAQYSNTQLRKIFKIDNMKEEILTAKTNKNGFNFKQ